MSRGIFTISIDVELAWGVSRRPISGTLVQLLGRERAIIKRLLKMFARYDIRATWAIVGHLLFTECAWDPCGTAHPELPRPILKGQPRDWFFQHPRDGHDPLWDGRDVVEWIRTARPPQEIGSHSCYHLPYSEQMANAKAIQADLDAAKQVHKTSGLPFETFVFPYNIVGFRDRLARAGIRVYRGNTSHWYAGIRVRPLRRLLTFLDFLLAVPPPTVTAALDEVGMINLPGSMLLFSQKTVRNLIPINVLAAKGTAGLRRAVERGEVFHLWFHPRNFVYNEDKQFSVLDHILSAADRLRHAGRLDMLTMGDVARARVNA